MNLFTINNKPYYAVSLRSTVGPATYLAYNPSTRQYYLTQFHTLAEDFDSFEQALRCFDRFCGARQWGHGMMSAIRIVAFNRYGT